MKDWLFIRMSYVALGPFPRWMRYSAALLLDMNPWLSKPRGE